MVIRVNTRANYGATTGSFVPPPPPYSGFEFSSPQFSDQSPVNPSRSPFEPHRIFKPAAAWVNTRSFVALVTFIITVGLCMSTMPVTHCNDPVDPQVRERIREEWSKELLEHGKQAAQREHVEAQWAWEDARHAALLREWEQERIEHERVLRERAQREEDERKRLVLFWGHVEAHQCKTYGTREYTAVLMNLPMNWERRIEACKATPLEVHGITHLPKSCEDRGHGFVMGRWEIDLYEPECNTFWNWYKDKGCTSPRSGKRRIEHYLENLPEGGDWREFCATTPARFHGMEFAGAQECVQWNYGTYGLWEIADINCR